MQEYCPICDEVNEVKIITMPEIYKIKGEDISVNADIAVCKECGEKLGSLDLDEKTLQAAFSIYRSRHNLLTPEKISSIRSKYLLSQRSLSKLLEWGEITVHRYENGALQDPAHNAVLMLIDDPKNMEKIFIKNAGLLSKSVRDRLCTRLKELLSEINKEEVVDSLNAYFDQEVKVGENSGYLRFDGEKMKNMILYIVKKSNSVFPTKLNKLLWYSDFYYYKKNTKSISGSEYVHNHYGPVPKHFQIFLAMMEEEGALESREVYFPDGSAGFEYSSEILCDQTIFTEEEKETMDFVIDFFKNYNATQIKDRSHGEKGYLETNHSEVISYKYAYDISLDT